MMIGFHLPTTLLKVGNHVRRYDMTTPRSAGHGKCCRYQSHRNRYCEAIPPVFHSSLPALTQRYNTRAGAMQIGSATLRLAELPGTIPKNTSRFHAMKGLDGGHYATQWSPPARALLSTAASASSAGSCTPS